MERLDPDILVGIPSYNRPQNVPLMQEYYDEIIWCVTDEKQAADYRSEGAFHVEISPRGKGLAIQRNHLYDIADVCGQFCLQMDDDLKSLKEWGGPKHADSTPMEFTKAANTILRAMEHADAHYGGALSTGNPFYGSSRIHIHAFIQAGFHILEAELGLRWTEDPRFKFKDDWEMTCRNLSDYGRVVRVDWIMPDFDFVSSRDKEDSTGLGKTKKGEMECAMELIMRYPDLVKKSNRPLELRMVRSLAHFTEEELELYDLVNLEVRQ